MYLVLFRINAKYLHPYRDDASSVELHRVLPLVESTITESPALSSSSRASTADSAL